MKTEKQIKGISGETTAENHLKTQGFRILERNWRYGHLEVDIIAATDKYLVIVEVKTRKSTSFGRPESFVNRQKQQNLVRAAAAYSKFNNISKEIRFDIISVVSNCEFEEIVHIEDAFKPKW